MISRGIYKKTISRDKGNGYTKFLFINEDNIAIYSTGYIHDIINGTPCIMEYEYNESLMQNVVQNIREDFSHRENSIAFLAGRQFPGIGKAKAAKIYDFFDGKLDEITNTPKTLEDLQNLGITEISALNFVSKLSLIKARSNLFNELSKYQASIQEINFLLRCFGPDAYQEFKKDPYLAGLKCNLSFEMCDMAGMSMGFDRYYNSRIIFVGYRIVSDVLNDGSSYADLDTIKKYFYYFFSKRNLPSISFLFFMTSLFANKYVKVVEEEDNELRIYLKKRYLTELRIAKEIKRLMCSGDKIEIQEEIQGNGISLDAEQKNAVKGISSPGIKLLHGGPGTGKTTTIKTIIEYFQQKYPTEKFALCAPTGCAAAKIKKDSGYYASTIHKLLEYKPYGDNETVYNELNRFPFKMILIDESSMADMDLFLQLLLAVKTGTIIYLVGDPDQLDSVGPGCILKDMIESGLFETFRLKVAHRQGKRQTLIDNSKKIIKGDINIKTDDTFELIQFHSEDECLKQIEGLYKKYEKKDSSAFQILSPVWKGAIGVNGINHFIAASKKHQMGDYFRNTKYALGDKIVMLKNNYSQNYINGDVGKIIQILGEGIMVRLYDEDILVPPENLSEMMHADAMTIHKSQGSEYDVVCIVLPEQPALMLYRSLLYVGVTRASKKVIILSQNDAVFTAIRQSKTKRRKTGLCTKLRKIFVS